MKILIIEDNLVLADTVKRALQSKGYIVDVAGDGKTGSYIARTNKYHIILLDLILPDKSGVIVCKDIRKSGITSPIIIISSQSDINDKITMLDIGADDYLTKPFSIEELIARIKALSRRPYNISDEVIMLHDLTINTSNQTVTKYGKEIYLTRKEYALLHCFARNEGKIVSRGHILEEVWEKDCNPFTNTIETHVRNLRKKIETNKKIIHTINGRGYKIST